MDYRVDSGNRRSLIKEQHKSSHLEERMEKVLPEPVILPGEESRFTQKQ